MPGTYTVEIVYSIVLGINYFLNVVSWALLVYCIMSWIVRPTNQFYILLSRFVAPLLAPFRPIARKLIERGFMIDISVLLAFVAIRLLRSVLPSLIYRLMGILS